MGDNKNLLKFFFMYLTCFLLGWAFSFYVDKYQGFGMSKTENYSDEIVYGEENASDSKLFETKEFYNIYKTLEENYYDQESLNAKQINEGMIRGMLESIDDPYAEYYTKSEYSDFMEVLEGDFEGIGVIIKKVDQGLLIENATKKSPAMQAGIRIGDIIIEVDGIPIQGKSISESIGLIKGKKDTTVKIKIMRADEDEPIEYDVIRKTIDVPTLEYSREGDIGYISLNLFGEKTGREIEKAIEQANNDNVEGLIIDVRGNGGGYLNSAVDVLNHFLPRNTLVVSTRFKQESKNEKFYSLGSSNVYDGKVVVLIDSNTASASEILAGALRENNRAILVGENTYGKGSVQSTFPVGNNAFIKFTISHWYTPKGVSIEKNGISPDIVVEFKPEDFEDIESLDDFYDRQKETAKTILHDYIDKDALQLTVDEYKQKNK